MKLSKETQEKVILGIQASLALIIIGLSVMDSARTQSAAMRKVTKRNAKELAKLQSREYKRKNKILKERYRQKLKAAKKSRFILKY